MNQHDYWAVFDGARYQKSKDGGCNRAIKAPPLCMSVPQ